MGTRMRSVRIAHEIREFTKQPPWGLSLRPKREDSHDVLIVTLQGPRGSPYEGGSFELTVTIPATYPYEPPLLKFVTPVYHPNIDKGGRICMDMLKMPPNGAWLPTITLETLLVSLQTLLATPNCDDPLMMEIAMEYKQDIEKFKANAKLYTERHAM